jgi:LPXTG-site transpeptidase (sortase) family protein
MTVLLGAAAPVLVVGGLVLAGGSLGGTAGDGAPAERTAATVAVQPPSVAPPASPSPRTSHERPVSRGGRPEAIVVPGLGVEAAVVPIRLEDRALTPPADPQQVGWWSQGARPGASTGSAVLTGHTVHIGGGAFDDLEELDAGDEVVVRTDRGALGYDVVSVEVLGKGELARRSADVFEQSGPARLVLVTCEDWDGTEYLSNVVVTARPSA